MIRPYLKVCGLHSEEDVRIVSESKADYVGFVMAESKRKITPHAAASWLKRHPMPDKSVAALFVNAPIDEIADAVNILSPDIVQLHGAETPDDVKKTKEVCQTDVWKALAHDASVLERMDAYVPYVDAFVIDAKVKGAWGGTGQRFDWSHVPAYVEFGRKQNTPVLIAGGINAENVAALKAFRPWGVDLSSGVETNGRKDQQKLNCLEKRLNSNE
ncbi:phosphoribosylanthranilate isomerase [Alteribacillus persepolensis]|uniref:N-(5'-phosphoribosyl)anthranilate isomerase n=1 Tax=Alteribacillus persepolensis TaxID=568899 RepID=A0A1G7ZFC3_9BACI|nr:phosphoribosylanthranilate isomerase [Alteribacillus persepolensis]SDH07441.1 phosphoribosylanthranilate isomerase [Alteribacillus persepolensis]